MSAAEVLIQTALLGEALDTGPALVFIADEDMNYIAVNESACRELGYAREELLKLRVTEIAREAVAPSQYDEMLARGFRHGTATLTRKDGTTVAFVYRATQTTVAGLPVFVSVGFALD